MKGLMNMKLVKNLFTIIKLNYYTRKINKIRDRLYENITSMGMIDTLDNYFRILTFTRTSKIPYCCNYDEEKLLPDYISAYNKLLSKVQSDIYNLKKIVNKTTSDSEYGELANSIIQRVESIVNEHNSRFLADVKRVNSKSAEILYQTDIIKDNIRTYTNQLVTDMDNQILGEQKK